ncbi:MAG: phosphoribosyl-ATP diphosphatase [Pseudomonadota bacterium]|nr:phosphoribosyl-ATP diphosphatase [Pseudomonadota bacterium]
MSETGKDYSSDILSRLFEVIESRKGTGGETSYTAKLLAGGKPKIARKVGEEAMEVLTATLAEGRGEVIAESADLLYHLLVLWVAEDIQPAEVWAELAGREGISGIEEKRSRSSNAL